jgi:hypothetical protein
MASALMITSIIVHQRGMLSKRQQMGDDRDFLASSVTDAQLKNMRSKYLDNVRK